MRDLKHLKLKRRKGAKRAKVLILHSGAMSLPLPPYPTFARPGSPEKMSVMEWRYVNGYAIHHPLDLKDREEIDSKYQELADVVIKTRVSKGNLGSRVNRYNLIITPAMTKL